MSIEPSQARTVIIRSPIPPKPAPVTLSPKMTHDDDAKLIRERARRTWGFFTASASRSDTNEKRSAEAKRRRDEMADRIADLLAKGVPMTAPQIQRHFAVSDNHTRVVLTEMAKAGRVTKHKGARGICLWALAEGASE